MINKDIWWKQFDPPKFIVGDKVYISDRGEAIECSIASVNAEFRSSEVYYEYELENVNNDEGFYYREESGMFTNRDDAEKPGLIAALEDRKDSLKNWIVMGKTDIQRLKGLTPEGIAERIKAAEDELTENECKLAQVEAELKELKGEQDVQI